MKDHSHPIIRILAAVALSLGGSAVPAAASTLVANSPVSRNYIISTQVMEGATLAHSTMAHVASTYALLGKPPMDRDTGNSGNYVASVNLVGGRIDIIYGGAADAAIASKTLSLTPYETADHRRVVWRCGNRPEPSDGVLPLLPLGTWANSPVSYVPSTVDDQFTAAACEVAEKFTDVSTACGVKNDFFTGVSGGGNFIRNQVAQGLRLADPAKKLVAIDATSMEWLSTAAAIFNSQNGGMGASSQYVRSVLIDQSTGAITITFNAAELGIQTGQDTLVLTPFVFGTTVQPLAAVIGTSEVMGTIDWACASATNTAAINGGMAGAITGTLLSIYAPPQCR